MSLIKGKPELKFVVTKGVNEKEFIITSDMFTEFEERYEPDFISHELEDGTLLRKLRGFRYEATVSFEKTEASVLLPFVSILDKDAYDKITFYPNATEKQYYNEEVTVSDDTISLACYYLLAQKDFDLKFVSRRLLTSVPLQLADFVAWGNITLSFGDLGTQTYGEMWDYE